ncbi:MAG: response regulator [Pseudomonadota bacterium]
MKGKTLAEKLAEAPENAQPIETPDDVQDIIDARGDDASAELPEAGDPQDVDAIVAAAKALRDGTPDEVRQARAKVCLIVDDSRVIRKVSSKIARSLGYVAIEAQDGTEALARCKQAMPHLVLTDWNMPEMDGLEFVTRLRAIPTPKPPTIVFCTSKGDAADIHEGIKAGADDYIVKPFDEAGLRAKLERLGKN